jgi:hypothetical protein
LNERRERVKTSSVFLVLNDLRWMIR